MIARKAVIIGMCDCPLEQLRYFRAFSGHLPGGDFNGERFWARGYAVSTVGFEEAQIRASIKQQEQLDTEGSDESGEF